MTKGTASISVRASTGAWSGFSETGGEELKHFRVESHTSGSVIYKADEAAERIYLLRSGRVRLVRPGSGDGAARQDCVHALLRPGDLFGDALRSSDATMDETAIAQGEVELWSIAGKDLRALVEARPPLALEIIRGMNDRVRGLRRRVNALTFKEVPARLAEAILMLGESHGDRCAHGGEIDLRGVTQQDLADLVGASRSFVSTLINEFKRDGLLGNVGRTLCILNLRELKQVASRDRI
jgi:CRP/FNR family cyclic AMP-dependent transcriptional regulator